ncbi:MAG: ROK family protein [Bacillota bacterium]
MGERAGSAEPLVVGVDVGGSNVRAALFRGLRMHGQVVARPTPAGGSRVLDEVIAVVEAVSEAAGPERPHIAAVGAGFPGIFDPLRGVSLLAGNLPDWPGGPVRDVLEQRLRLPVAVDNDVRAGGYGEVHAGVAVGAGSVVYVSVGTGVGGAVFLDGKPYLGATFAAGEVGHVVLDPSAAAYRCRCGQVGDAEALVSGYAIERAAWRAAGRAIRATDALTAGRDGAEGLKNLYGTVARYLALLFANIATAFNPELIVVGGGLGTHPSYPVEEACALVRQGAVPQWIADRVRVKRARLGQWSGLVGAAVLALEKAGYKLTPMPETEGLG